MGPPFSGCLSQAGESLACACWGWTHPSLIPTCQQHGAASQFSRVLVGDLCTGSGNSNALCTLTITGEGIWRGIPPDHHGLGVEQPLLGKVLTFFASADATNGCSTTVSAGAVTHPASLETGRNQRPHCGSVPE